MYLLHQTVEEAALAHPGHVAFRCESESVTYGDLASQTNQLAHALIEHGVRQGDRVGVLMPRCNQSAVAVHGIMKSGAAFVPLDPHSPVAVLQDLIKFCGIKSLVTFGQKAPRLHELLADSNVSVLVGANVETTSGVCIDWNDLANFPTTIPTVNVLEHDLAYVMFTSGSTGRPKGIMHTHHSGLAYARLSVDTYGVRPEDVIGSHSPLHFDMSTFGYLSGPLAAATVSLIPEAYTRLPASLSQLIESHRISIWYSVPFALIQLLLRGALESRDLTSLRWVLFGGEPFPSGHLYELMAKWPHARFSNVYGPAEVNQCTYYHLPPRSTDRDSGEPESVPIGKTWPNTSALVVDDDDTEVLSGDQGELLIRSSTMMQGYWNRPDLNATAFFKREMPSGIVESYYRTGDLVRQNEKGELLFLGRKDRQVKVRGYRVELDAVEQALSSHEAVEEVGAFVVRTTGDAAVIASTVTVRRETDVAPQELIAHAKGLLPWYAVPAVVRVLDDLPRTTSGKIDRRLLAESFADGAG